MPAVLTNLTMVGGRLRGLSPAIAPDEPLRRAEGAAAAGGGRLVWRTEAGTSATLTIDDSDNGVEFTAGSDVALLVPAYADQAIEAGTSILLVQLGAGQIVVTGAPGVTIRVRPIFLAKSAGQYAPMSLTRLKTLNHWLLSGDLALA